MRRAVAVGVLVLLVAAGEHAGLHEVLAEDLRVVVLEDEQILVVAERRLVPERLRSRRRPRRPDGPVWSPYCFAAVAGRSAGDWLVISAFRPGVQAAAGRSIDLVRRVRELELLVALRARASGSARPRTTGSAGPSSSRRRGTDRRPTGSCGRSARCSSSCPACSAPSARLALLSVQSARPSELAVVDRRRHRGHPVVAAAAGRRDVRQRIQLQERLARRAEPVRRNPVARERLARSADRSGSAASSRRSAGR